jgi:hypothetical protein
VCVQVSRYLGVGVSRCVGVGVVYSFGMQADPVKARTAYPTHSRYKIYTHTHTHTHTHMHMHTLKNTHAHTELCMLFLAYAPDNALGVNCNLCRGGSGCVPGAAGDVESGVCVCACVCVCGVRESECTFLCVSAGVLFCVNVLSSFQSNPCRGKGVFEGVYAIDPLYESCLIFTRCC